MNGPALLALQAIDTALDSVANRRARLPEAINFAAAGAALDDHRGRLAAARRRAVDAQAVIEASERESAALTSKRNRLEQQLKSVTNVRQAEALDHEIAAVNAERNALDDRELAAMEEVSSADVDAAELAADEPQVAAVAESAKEALDLAHTQLDEEQATLLAERGVNAATLSAEEIATYERMRATHGGVGVATLVGQRCTGCHLDLSRGEVDIIRAMPPDVLAECPQCGRLLVLT